MYFYDEIWDLILNAKWKKNFWPGCFVDWDNTPRNKHGVMVSGFSVEKFAEYMKILVQRARKVMYAYMKEDLVKKVLDVCSLSYRTFSNFLTGQCLEAVILGTMFVICMTSA